MKLLLAKFILEANAHVPMFCDMEHVALSYEYEALSHMQLGTVFQRDDIDLVPVICADAGCSGVMKKECFAYIEQRILKAVKQHLKDLDGIYLHLHGASEVETIGSGEHHLVNEIRNIVGPYLPIAIVCDPHGNLSQDYVEQATIIRSYREAPHTDIAQTIQFVCEHLLELIENRKVIKPVYRKLPLILGGEQSVSTDEPVLSINKLMNEMEQDERILSCSWHVGYLRHDTPVAGCGVVVIPSDDRYRDYANEIADNLATYVMAKRHEFHYTGTSTSLEDALQMAFAFEDKPVFISDSGDNVTSGAMGANTSLLRKLLEVTPFNKRCLVAAINDPISYQMLSKKEIGSIVSFDLGMGIDEDSEPVKIEGTLAFKGRQEGTHMFGEHGDYGGLVRITLSDKPMDIVITDNNHSFVEQHQIEACGVDWDDYDVFFVKQGYLHPELKEKGKLNIMALTNGATLQDTKRIPFKLIMRPMFPIDDI